METLKRWSTVGALGGLLALGGLGASAVQNPQPPKIDVDRIVAELELSDAVKAEVVPELNRLNELLAESAASEQPSRETQRAFREVFSNVFPKLTWEQRRQLHQALRDAGAFGPWNGHMGGYAMGQQMMGRQHMMGGNMGFGSGQGCWGDAGAISPGSGARHGQMHGTPWRGGPGARR